MTADQNRKPIVPIVVSSEMNGGSTQYMVGHFSRVPEIRTCGFA